MILVEKILLAVDGSKYADKTLMETKKLGIAFNSEITILYVLEDIGSYPYVRGSDTAALEKVFNEQAKKILDVAMENFKDYKGKIEILTKWGNTGSEIIKVAEEGDYSIVIMGSRGVGAISRPMLGGVSTKVANGTNISVLLVK